MHIKAFDTSNKPSTLPIQEFYLGLDCGQTQDYSALSILQKQANRYSVVHLERLPLNMPYPQQIDYVSQLWHKKPLSGAIRVMAIDCTGVGLPVFDLAREKGLSPVGISITGGDSVTWLDDRTRARVPKRDLISGLQVAAQNDVLKVAKELEFGPVLADELASFRVKIDPRTAHDSYGSWREGQHDDLILSLAIALWIAQYRDVPTHAVLRYISRVGARR